MRESNRNAGTNLDGFAKTYEHVLPGMQGNNIWMTRQLAWLRELQGRAAEARSLRAEASAMSAETVRTMFATSRDGQRAWWNVLWPEGEGGLAEGQPLRAYEMRHVVDFFSMAFGLCGVGGGGGGCDLDATQRAQLSRFFHQELRTSDWIRATSPKCNCSNSYTVPRQDAAPDTSSSAGLATAGIAEDEWPGSSSSNPSSLLPPPQAFA